MVDVDLVSMHYAVVDMYQCSSVVWILYCSSNDKKSI